MSLNRTEPSQLDETIVVPPPPADDTRGSITHGPMRMASELSAAPTHEGEALLQQRLRAAVIVLCTAVSVFFVRGFWLPDAPAHLFQGIVAGVLAISVAALSLRSFPLNALRWGELALFGVTAIFLGVYEYELVLIKTRDGNPMYELAAIKSCVLYFFGVIMLYGTFIPNTPRRAACVVFPMSIVPGVVHIILRTRVHDFFEAAASLANFEQISDHVLMLGLAAGSAVYSVHVMNTLRQEALRARQLGQYRLKQRIGAGGMGEVYLAEHQLLKRPCAIKLIRRDSQSDPHALARFEREVRTTAKLTHWNTVDVFDYGHTEDGTFYYVMEFLPGLSLADLVERHGPLAPARAVHLLRQTCQALREAHQIGLVHRDIKPANIFAARLGGVHDVAKLLDFGLVKQTLSDAKSSAVSQEGTFTGSPLYMSPEQATAAQDPDSRSDIYSLGATAYYLLTGRPPFQGENPIQVMIAHARDPVTPPRDLRPEVPADVEAVVLRCLEKTPADRFPDVTSLEKAFAACSVAGQWSPEDAEHWWLTVAAETESPDLHKQADLHETSPVCQKS